MSNRTVRAVSLCLILGAGCGDDGGDPAAPDGGAEPDGGDERTLLGTWVVTGGPLLTLPGAEQLVQSVGLILDDDGTGFAVFLDVTGQATNCAPIFHTASADSLVIDYGAGLAPFGRVLTIDDHGGDSVALHDEDGRVLFLARPRDGLPEVVCTELVELARHDDLPAADGFTKELEIDGGTAFYVDDDNSMFQINLATGEVGSKITNLNAMPVARQDASFWTHCACGGSEDATLIAPGGSAQDTVSTDTLGQQIQIDIGAVDGAGTLWLGGNGNDGVRRILKITTTGEPDVLVATIEVPTSLFPQSLAFDGTSLWAVAQVGLGSTVLRFDADTGEVLGSFAPPTVDRVFWHSLAIHDGRAFMLGVRNNTIGILVEVELPAG